MGAAHIWGDKPPRVVATAPKAKPSEPALRKFLETGEKSSRFVGKITLPAEEVLARIRERNRERVRKHRARKQELRNGD